MVIHHGAVRPWVHKCMGSGVAMPLGESPDVGETEYPCHSKEFIDETRQILNQTVV